MSVCLRKATIAGHSPSHRPLRVRLLPDAGDSQASPGVEGTEGSHQQGLGHSEHLRTKLQQHGFSVAGLALFVEMPWQLCALAVLYSSFRHRPVRIDAVQLTHEASAMLTTDRYLET